MRLPDVFELETPRTRDEIAAGLERLAGEISEYLAGLPVDELLAPQGEAWSPERHLRHLSRSVGAVVAGMRVPRFLLRLRFGRPRRPSRSFDEVVASYRAALDAGGRASGRYLPTSPPEDAAPGEWRDRVLERWQRLNRDLCAAVRGWSEGALDRHQAPHPLLGKMTVREILFFTLYHNAHHARRIRERRGELPTGP